MSSNRSHRQRPEDVTLPPISQIFNAPSSNTSSLPPLRASREGSELNQHSSHRSSSNRAYGNSPGYLPVAPDLQDPQLKRARHHHAETGGPFLSSQPHPPGPPPFVRTASSHSAHEYVPPMASRHQSSGRTEQAAIMHPGRMENRHMGAPPSGYGPSQYSYVPPPPNYVHSSSHGARAGPPTSYVEGSRSGGSRAHEHLGNNIPAGQGYNPDEHGSSKAPKYECSYCGKGFLRPSALKIHIISHTGDKDFVCPEESCRRRFGVRSNMLRHIRLVHQNHHSQSSGEEQSKDDWSE